jgi:hypothetical protein
VVAIVKMIAKMLLCFIVSVIGIKLNSPSSLYIHFLYDVDDPQAITMAETLILPNSLCQLLRLLEDLRVESNLPAVHQEGFKQPFI